MTETVFHQTKIYDDICSLRSSIFTTGEAKRDPERRGWAEIILENLASTNFDVKIDRDLSKTPILKIRIRGDAELRVFAQAFRDLANFIENPDRKAATETHYRSSQEPVGISINFED